MLTFCELIQQKLRPLSPFYEQQVHISGNLFSCEKHNVLFFVKEIEKTAQQLSLQQNEDYANAYADKLFRQFEALNQAVILLKKSAKVEKPHFQSSFSFKKNIHRLPPEKRLVEYRKALRALNEKISWLIEQGYSVTEQEKTQINAQILETEYRKEKCLQAIEALEDSLSFK